MAHGRGTVRDMEEPLIAMTPELDAAIGRLIDLRGGILSIFAQVEWFSAKLIDEAQHFPEYQGLDLSFSQDFEKRAARLQRILSVPGPYDPYAADILASIAILQDALDYRHFSAHGVLAHDWTPEGMQLHFRMFRMFKGGELHEGSWDVSLVDYHAAVRHCSIAAKTFVSTMRRLWRDLGLKNFDDTFNNRFGIR